MLWCRPFSYGKGPVEDRAPRLHCVANPEKRRSMSRVTIARSMIAIRNRAKPIALDQIQDSKFLDALVNHFALAEMDVHIAADDVTVTKVIFPDRSRAQ